MHPLSLLVTCVAGWMNAHQQALIEYLQEEVRVLKAQVGKRPHFTDDQRRRLGIRAKAVGRKGLMRFASIVTPDTLLVWHHRLIAQKYDSSQRRRPGRRPNLNSGPPTDCCGWACCAPGPTGDRPSSWSNPKPSSRGIAWAFASSGAGNPAPAGDAPPSTPTSSR